MFDCPIFVRKTLESYKCGDFFSYFSFNIIRHTKSRSNKYVQRPEKLRGFEQHGLFDMSNSVKQFLTVNGHKIFLRILSPFLLHLSTF